MRIGPFRWMMATAVGSAIACASPGWPPLVGPAREQPAWLVGRWASPSDTTREDTTRRERLVLAADGEQWTEVAIDSAGTMVVHRTSPRAWWWVYRGAARPADELCLHWRGGRHRADCEPYQLDTVQVSGHAMSRLRWGGIEWIAAP